MSRRYAAVLAMVTCLSTPAMAETIGIRFIVSHELGLSAQQQQSTQHKLRKYIDTLNSYFLNSEVMLKAEIVQIEFSRIGSTVDTEIIADMAHERKGFEDLFLKAREYGADYTIAMASTLMMKGKPGCGRAYAVNKTIADISSTRTAFAVVNFVCGAHTLAHELGHLMGLNHGTLVDSCHPGKGHTSAITPYANGYAEGTCDGLAQAGEFGDIMVGGYMHEISGGKNLPFFSNPRISDKRCGTAMHCGNTSNGDAARALNENAHYYAAHETRKTH